MIHHLERSVGRSTVIAADAQEGARARPLFDPPIVKRAIKDSFVKLNPRTMMKNPVMFVVEVGAAMTTILAVRDIAREALGRLHVSDHALAVVHGAVRQFRRSHGGRPRQGAGRHACARPRPRPPPSL
jgi:hypothetical protein